MLFIILQGKTIILTHDTLLEQFQKFYIEHKPQTMEDAIEKFAIFGGVEWAKIDCSQDSLALIETLVLPDFTYIRNDVTELTTGLPLHHSILSGIAQGDGRTQSAFKRSSVSAEVGTKAIEELKESGIITVLKPKMIGNSWKEKESVANKLLFASPFLRFWFAFVSPIFKGIRDGDYKEVRTLFSNRFGEFLQLPFVELSHELIKLSFVEDKIAEIQSYWDNEIEFDILAKTESGKVVVGICKYTNTKLKKSELSRLQELAVNAGLNANIFVLVSKSGFSNELKSLKGQNLRLITLKNFKKLVE